MGKLFLLCLCGAWLVGCQESRPFGFIDSYRPAHFVGEASDCLGPAMRVAGALCAGMSLEQARKSLEEQGFVCVPGPATGPESRLDACFLTKGKEGEESAVLVRIFARDGKVTRREFTIQPWAGLGVERPVFEIDPESGAARFKFPPASKVEAS